MSTLTQMDVSSSLPEDLEKAKGVVAALSPFQQKAQEVRANRVNWQSYFQGKMIERPDFEFITRFESLTPEQKVHELMDPTVRLQSARTFINLMGQISKDQTVQYVLTLLDDMLQEDKSRVEIFIEYARKHAESVWNPFTNMLNRPDPFIVNQASRIIAKIACWSRDGMTGADLQYYLNWVKEQLRAPNNEYLQTVCRCLQMMLRIDNYRKEFINVEGVSAVLSALGSKQNFQIQYQLIFCLWCLSFNASLAERMSKSDVVRDLSDILRDTVKEKVIRIILATFRNLLEKPTEPETSRDFAISMVQHKVLRQLELLENKKFDDIELTEDIQALTEKLQTSVQDLSSFDEYWSEVRSGRLEWSPVHKMDRFWRENAMKFNENNYQVLKALIKLLEASKDPLILCVASHDLGEYVRHYPRGKSVIEQLNGKQCVMRLLAHEDPNVRYHALLCVQKLMVQNWEYLGKQLEDPNKPIETKS